jgi:tetratricopeptide (TPR) repeat protein
MAARAIDPNPFRDRLRAALMRPDPATRSEALRTLAGDPELTDQPAATAVLLGWTLAELGLRSEGLTVLRQAQARHPDNVWANFYLADRLDHDGPSAQDEAIIYYMAARALRPETSHALSHLLARRGRVDEAVAIMQDLIRRRPDDPRHEQCLRGILRRAQNPTAPDSRGGGG